MTRDAACTGSRVRGHQNGMFLRNGYAFFTPSITIYASPEGNHLKELYSTNSSFFRDYLLADGTPQSELI